MKTDNLPPRTTISEIKSENKPIELIFNYSTNEKFPIQLTEELLEGQNPKQLIEKIKGASDKDFTDTSSGINWIIGYAPHGRGLCNKCKSRIREKELRFRLMESKDSVLNPELYHFKCFTKRLSKQDSIHGISKLREEDQKKIRKMIPPEAEQKF